MTSAMRWLLAVALMLTLGAARGEEYLTFQGCVDADGRAVPSQLDRSLVRAVDTAYVGGRPTIRYNPDVLPELRSDTRLFMYAHECARHELGLPAGEARTLEDARRADCAGLATLLRSDLLVPRDVAAIEHDAALTPDAWALLPGPARTLALDACLEELAARPSLAHPVKAQPDWNSCVRACGEPLRACKRTCSGAACDDCQSRYEQCSSMCDFRFPL